MIRGLLKKERSPRRSSLSDIDDVDANNIPFMSFEQLIDITNQTNRLRNIRRLTTLDNSVYEELYTPAIARYARAAQLQPASQVDHHSYYGGLLVHTLEVVESALKMRQQYLLPKNAPTERILEEEHVWTYAIFAGALLHDAGKLLTLTRLKLPNGSHHCPFSTKIDYERHYQIEYTGSSYSFQTKSSGLMFKFLPEIGVEMLSGNIPALEELTGWLFHEAYEWGTIGEIVQKADSRSTASNISSGGAKRRLPGAKGVPLAERFITAIRSLIHEKEIGFNRNGAAGWVEGDYTYLVCGPIIDTAREKLKDEGSSDIPEDNSVIFTILQDHGYIVPNSINKAIWHVTVRGDGYSHPFTMLKFETSRIFHPSMRPTPFKGDLTTNEYDAATDVNTLESDDDMVLGLTNTNTASDSNISNSNDANSRASTISEPSSVSNTEPDVVDENDMSSETAPDSKSESKRSKNTTPKLSDPDIATTYFDWLNKKLVQREISLNKRNALVHTTPVGTIVISPGIFKSFLVEYNMQGASDDALEERWRLLQKHVIATKRHLVNGTGNNVHYIKVTISDNSGFHAMLYEHSELWGGSTLPKHNKLLEVSDPEDVAPATETAAVKKRIRDKQKMKEADSKADEELSDDFELEHE